MQIRRRFVQVGSRRVHYFRAGDGPPAVLIHSSPANARLLMKEIEFLARHFTIFAFDTPGFGLSDPLPLAEMEVADLADALAETLAVTGMPRCPVFGTHTGAAIALELGVRHSDRVTGLVLDGVPAFTDAECEQYFATYFRTMPPSELGGHYAEAWTRFRDQAIWFPWTNRTPANLNAYDLSPPHSTHLWVSMFFDAAEHYAPAYRAASYYGAKAIAAARALTLPAIYCATETDMLYPHLARLPEMKQDQAIVPIGASLERKRDVILESFVRFGADGAAPLDRDAIGSTSGIARQFINGPAGQMHLRSCGEVTNPPLLLLHDAPGSSEQAEPLIARLAEAFFVIAPDMPGCGESDGFADTPDMAAFAKAAAATLDVLGVAKAALYGIGFGSSVALAMAERHPGRVTGLALQSVLLPDEQERQDLRERFAPPIEVVADGAHWYRTWIMLRDSRVYWPWYDRRFAATRKVPASFDTRELHRWTMDVMRSRTTYAQIIDAALIYDAATALDTLRSTIVRISDSGTPASAYNERFQSISSKAVALDTSIPDLAQRLAMTFDHSSGTNRAYSESQP